MATEKNSRQTPVKNRVWQLEEEMAFPKGGIFSRVIAKGKAWSLTLMCLSAGSEIEEHTSAKEGLVHVTKGTGEFVLFAEKIRLVPGTLISLPRSAPHSLSAKTDLAINLYLSEA